MLTLTQSVPIVRRSGKNDGSVGRLISYNKMNGVIVFILTTQEMIVGLHYELMTMENICIS